MKEIHLDMVRVTEAAAIAASAWIGSGDKKAADAAATAAMRERLSVSDPLPVTIDKVSHATGKARNKLVVGTSPKGRSLTACSCARRAARCAGSRRIMETDGGTMRRSIAFAFLLLLTASSAWAGRNERQPGALPAVMLTAPGDNAEVRPGQPLEFRWSSEGGSREYYDFRLYKGHETVERGLILKERVPRDQPFYRASPDLFEDGETYAWSVRQVGIHKSALTYSVFKARKAAAGA